MWEHGPYVRKVTPHDLTRLSPFMLSFREEVYTERTLNYSVEGAQLIRRLFCLLCNSWENILTAYLFRGSG